MGPSGRARSACALRVRVHAPKVAHAKLIPPEGCIEGAAGGRPLILDSSRLVEGRDVFGPESANRLAPEELLRIGHGRAVGANSRRLPFKRGEPAICPLGEGSIELRLVLALVDANGDLPERPLGLAAVATDADLVRTTVVTMACVQALRSGPGRNRTCDLGIKSPTGTTAAWRG